MPFGNTHTCVAFLEIPSWGLLLPSVDDHALSPGGGGVLPKKLGRGVRPTSQNPYPIYDQNLRFSLPYL